MIVVTGTGRAGTSLLMLILSNCGVNTGVDEGDFKEDINAGMELEFNECNVRAFDVIKSPELSGAIDELVRLTEIKHVIIPMRDIDKVVKSRIDNNLLVETTKPGNQKYFLLKRHYELIYKLSKYSIPFTLIDYDKMIESYEYLWNKIKDVFPEITESRFRKEYTLLVDKSLNHYK